MPAGLSPSSPPQSRETLIACSDSKRKLRIICHPVHAEPGTTIAAASRGALSDEVSTFALRCTLITSTREQATEHVTRDLGEQTLSNLIG